MTLIKRLILIAIPLIISAILLFIKNNLISDQINCFNEINLFIGILSDRKNFDKRLSITKTWFESINKINNSKISSELGLSEFKLNVKFIIGSKDCSIPPRFRTNPYSCHLNHIKFNPNITQLYLHHFNPTKTFDFNSHKKVFRGFSFLVSL